MALFILLPTLVVALAVWGFIKYALVRGNHFAQWLSLLFIGTAVIMSGQLEEGLLEKIAVNVWACSVVGLPIWWAFRAVRRAWKG
jgi:hypothetical protein